MRCVMRSMRSMRPVSPVRAVNAQPLNPLRALRALSLSFALTPALLACGGGGGNPADPTPQTKPQAQGRVKADPDNPNAKPQISKAAKELFVEAGQLASSGNTARALELYERAYAEDQNITQALYNIALLHDLAGDQAKAVEAYRRAVDAGLGDGWVGIGLMQLASGNEGEAESSFRRALELEPLNGRAHLNLARIAKDQGSFKEAMESVRNALKEDSTNADAYNMLAQVYYKMGRFKLAQLVADAGLQDLDPKHSGLWTTQGLIYLKLDDVIKATASFRAAIENDPKNFAARLNLGVITFSYRDYERSYQLLSEAAALSPNNVEVVLTKAVVARSLERLDEARAGYQRALELSPHHPGALFNLAVLNQDYAKLPEGDFDGRARVIQEALRSYEDLLGLAQDEGLRKKLTQRIEDGKVMLEALDVEKEMAKQAPSDQPAPAEGQP